MSCQCILGALILAAGTALGQSQLDDFKGVVPANPGPNCSNTALVHAGLNAFVRHTSPEEFAFWMDSQACEQLSKPAALSIARVHTQAGEEIHAYVHLSNETVLSKNGQDIESPPLKTYSLQALWQTYGWTQRSFAKEELVLDHHRCRSWASIVSTLDTQTRPTFLDQPGPVAWADREETSLRHALETLNAIEHAISDVTVKKKTRSSWTRERALDALSEMRNFADDHASALDNSSQTWQRLFWKGLFHRTQSLRQQIFKLEYGPREWVDAGAY